MGSRSRARARAQASEAAGQAAAQRPAGAGRRAAGAGQRDAGTGQQGAGTRQRGTGTGPAAGQPAAARPVTVAGAAVVQAVEAAGVLAATVLAGIDAADGGSYQTSSGVALTIIGAGTVVMLAAIAWGLARARRWSRTPALLTQLFTGIVGIYLIQGHRYEWGVPGVVLAVAGFALLLVPPSLRALAAGRPSPPAS
ncbi:MAG: hypothetical protein ACLP7J_25325 [Streptosporangiaceae bacterium]